MQTTKRILKRTAITLLGVIATAINASLLTISPTSAANVNPSLTLTTQTPVGVTQLVATGTDGDRRNYYIPVKISTNDIAKYSISIQASSTDMIGKNTTNGQKNKISGITSGTSKNLGQMTNEWGYRWNFGATAEDAVLKDFSAVPTTKTQIVEHFVGNTVGNSSTNYLSLGFGASVNKTQPADVYSNKITISVIGEPVGTTIHSITNMQDMYSDICDLTTTPSPSATQTDTTGTHWGDSNYVPEKTLIDTRDNRTYTIRKLADGNCWMAQNLELDIKPNSVFTNNDTDLNSLTSWSPTINQQKYGIPVYATGTKLPGPSDFTQDDGFSGLYSTSLKQINANYTYTVPTGSIDANGNISFTQSSIAKAASLNSVSVVLPTGTAGNTQRNFAAGEYQRNGNLYDWYSSTLGSGSVVSNHSISSNSICPRGWELPQQGYNVNNGDFLDLLGAYGITNASNGIAQYNTVSSWPIDFVSSGRWWGHIDGGTKPEDQNMGSSLWGSYSASSDSAAALVIEDTGGLYISDEIRTSSFSIRCIAR